METDKLTSKTDIMAKKYKICGVTNPYIADRDAQFKGRINIGIEHGLTLGEAQGRLLAMFNEKYGKCYPNWGLARAHHNGETTTYMDGTRSFEYDSRFFFHNRGRIRIVWHGFGTD